MSLLRLHQSLLSGSGPAGPFDYAAFLGGKSGDAWLAGELCYTDSGRATPATAGTTVYWMDGQGAQFNFSQVTSANRPTLQTDSGKFYLAFDGTNDRMSAGSSGDWNYAHNSAGDCYLAVACNAGASSNPNNIHYLLTTTNLASASIGLITAYDDRSGVSANNAARLTVSRNTGGSWAIDSFVNATFQPQTDVLFEYIKTGTSVGYYINGALAASGTLASPSASNSTGALTLGDASTTSTGRLSGRIYGAILCNAVPDSSERAAILADMAARCAVPPSI